jgi:2-haloalkanoic acid dehalogenase type II
MIKLIIFDCWGTLFYKSRGPRALSEFSKRLGYDKKTDYKYLKTFERNFMLTDNNDYETPFRNLIFELKISLDENKFQELLRILRDNPNHNTNFPETFEVLDSLKERYKLVLLSNAEPIAFKLLRNKYHLDEIFDEVITSFETGLLKPDPKLFENILEKFNVNTNEVLMVGDSLKDDVLAAENCGIKGILLDRDNRHPDYKNRITSLEKINEYI